MRWMATSLMLGGALTVLVNVALTPFLHGHGGVFLWRQSLSAVAAACLLFGSIALYLHHADRRDAFNTLSFVAACIGSALVLATEWSQIFGTGEALSDAGAIAALGTFTIGWIAFAASTLRRRILPKGAAILVIAGFFAIPMLQAVLGRSGAIAGNVVLGSGWMWLGYALREI